MFWQATPREFEAACDGLAAINGPPDKKWLSDADIAEMEEELRDIPD